MGLNHDNEDKALFRSSHGALCTFSRYIRFGQAYLIARPPGIIGSAMINIAR